MHAAVLLTFVSTAALAHAGILTRQDDSIIAASAAAAAAQALGASGSSPRQPVAASGTGSVGSVAAATPGPRSSTLKPFQSTVASLPEAAGLPYDESYAYLCLLRR
jgi:hypothetical protein